MRALVPAVPVQKGGLLLMKARWFLAVVAVLLSTLPVATQAVGGPTTLPEGSGGPFDMTKYLSPALRAQGFTITFSSDATETATTSDFFTLFQNAVFVSTASVSESDSVLDGGRPLGLVSIGGIGITPDVTQFGNYTVLTEPDGSISDVFGVVLFGPTFFFGFASDFASTPVPSVPLEFIPVSGPVPEPSTFALLGLGGLGLAGYAYRRRKQVV
jgi:hypothetical protein